MTFGMLEHDPAYEKKKSERTTNKKVDLWIWIR